jgi:hypothetical protein
MSCNSYYFNCVTILGSLSEHCAGVYIILQSPIPAVLWCVVWKGTRLSDNKMWTNKLLLMSRQFPASYHFYRSVYCDDVYDKSKLVLQTPSQISENCLLLYDTSINFQSATWERWKIDSAWKKYTNAPSMVVSFGITESSAFDLNYFRHFKGELTWTKMRPNKQGSL